MLLILANGVLALSEMALVSSRRSRLEGQAEKGDGKAKAALALIDKPSIFLSTVQIGITLVGTLAGSVGGATLVERLAPALAGLPLPRVAAYAEPLALGLVVLGITYLTLIVGELVPKRIAMAQADSLARLVAPGMTRLARVTRPLVTVLSASTEAVLRMLGQQVEQQGSADEEEIRYLMAEGARTGVFARSERDLVERVFDFADLRVGELMRPRSEVLAIDIEMSSDDIHKLVRGASYSRFPVYREDLDHILGIVHAMDILLQGETVDLRKILRPPVYVPDSQLIATTLRTFQSTHSHMAIVLNEYGSTEGIVTLEDVLEELVGEIQDEHDRSEQTIVRRDDGTLLVDGLLPVGELKELLETEEIPDEDQYQYNTLAGLIIAHLGRLPRVADHIELLDRRFEVVDMDGRRVDRVLISPLPTPDDASNDEA